MQYDTYQDSQMTIEQVLFDYAHFGEISRYENTLPFW